jgi:homoserine O-acetyltransferase/O-succinyltransferase
MTSRQDGGFVQTRSVTFSPGGFPDTPGACANLQELTVAYEMYGALNPAGDNAILVCHALTGSAHAAGLSSADPRSAGWWDPLIGPGRPLDTDRYCVISSNFLGGCYGTTGPTSVDPRTGKRFGMSFPEYTVRDMVHVQKALLDHLGVHSLVTVIGGSLGGMQVLEWPLCYPKMVRSIVPIATASQHSAWCIGLNDLARQAIMNDPAWRGGAYEPDRQPAAGLSLARQIAMVTYRSDVSFDIRFQRERAVVPPGAGTPASRYQVESYLRYQGDKLVARFDANTYLYISRAMDDHDVAAGRGPLGDVLGSIGVPSLNIGITSDLLYPVHEQRTIAAALPRSVYREIDSPDGHDAFLIAYDQLGPFVHDFLKEL